MDNKLAHFFKAFQCGSAQLTKLHELPYRVYGVTFPFLIEDLAAVILFHTKIISTSLFNVEFFSSIIVEILFHSYNKNFIKTSDLVMH